MARSNEGVARMRERGLRATPQRIRLFALLSEAGTPRGVDELVRAGRGSYDTATAYRILDAFREKGLVRRIEVDAGRALYEVADGAHHHHAVCTSCGTIRDVSVCIPAGLDAKVRRAAGFSSLASHRLEFFGLCARCA